MQPLDPSVHYGQPESNPFATPGVQLELLPVKLHQLRGKLHEKARNEPKFRFYALYDRIYRMDVLEAAWKHVGKKNKAPGIDGVRAEDILAEEGRVATLLATLHEELKTKSYHPLPVKRTHIPKADGSLRPLGVPALRDRVVQMAVVLILEPIFEADFLDCSHGFRPGRKAHDALDEIRQNLKDGRTSVYDADLKGYFDTIPHDKLIACLRKRVVDKSVIGLIRKWLRSPVIELDEKTRNPKPPRKSNGQGTPQGGVLSPLLANIYLHWFDVMFHRKDGPRHWANARLVRYADDFASLSVTLAGIAPLWLSPFGRLSSSPATRATGSKNGPGGNSKTGLDWNSTGKRPKWSTCARRRASTSSASPSGTTATSMAARQAT